MGIASVCCLVALAITPVSAGFQTGGFNGGMDLTNLLDHLEMRGLDVSAIQAAQQSGDEDTLRTLLQQLLEEQKNDLPAPDGGEDRITRHLDRLEEQGYDVSAIRAAVEAGDAETARTLMQQFIDTCKEGHPACTHPGHPRRGAGA